MFATSARGRRTALILLILISALAIGITSTQATDPNVGATRLAADGTPAVVLIGDEPMSADDFKQNVGAVNSNLSQLQGQIASGSQNSASLQSIIDMINTHGVENVALADMIENQALYDLAVARGFGPSDDVVQAKVAQDKALASKGIDPTTAAYIASVGEDRFWTTLYPATVRRNLATQALLQDTIKGKASSDEANTAWNQVQQQALDATHVTVLNPDAIAPASMSAAIDYLHAYWQFSGQ
jgi:hypothetical protein